MKKKIILVLLSIFVVTSLVACNNNKTSEVDNEVNDNKNQEVTNNDEKQDTSTQEKENEEMDLAILPYNFTTKKRNEFIWNYDDVIFKRGKGYDVNEHIKFIKENWPKIEDGLTANEEQLVDDMQNSICHLIGFESDPEIQDAGNLMYSYLMTLVGMQSRDLDEYGEKINNFLESR